MLPHVTTSRGTVPSKSFCSEKKGQDLFFFFNGEKTTKKVTERKNVDMRNYFFSQKWKGEKKILIWAD